MYINIRTAYSWFYRHIVPTAFRDPQRNSSKCAQTAHREVTLLQIKNKSLNDKVVCIDTAIYSYQLVIKNTETVFFFLYLNNGVCPPFPPPSCWSSCRGKSVSKGPKRRKRKQEGADTLQHQQGFTININLHGPILSTSGRECDFHEVNEAGDSVGRWQLDTIIFSF